MRYFRGNEGVSKGHSRGDEGVSKGHSRGDEGAGEFRRSARSHRRRARFRSGRSIRVITMLSHPVPARVCCSWDDLVVIIYQVGALSPLGAMKMYRCCRDSSGNQPVMQWRHSEQTLPALASTGGKKQRNLLSTFTDRTAIPDADIHSSKWDSHRKEKAKGKIFSSYTQARRRKAGCWCHDRG